MASAFITKGVRKLGHQFLLRRAKGSVALSNIRKFQIPDTEVTTLDNGVRIASEDWGSPTTTVGVWMDVGTRFENDSNNGVSNFLEHVAFKGTGKRSGAEIEKEAEKRGVQLRAFTSREMTAFFAQCQHSDLAWAVELLGEVAKNTTFDDAVVDAARAEILHEMNEAETNYPEVVQDYLHATAFQGTPLSRTILGPLENVKAMKADDLHVFADGLYKAPRMVVACAGGASHKEISDLAAKHFGDVSATYEREIPDVQPCRYTGSEIKDRDDAMPFAHVAIAVEGPGWKSTETIPLLVASYIHGSWDKFQSNATFSPSKLVASFCSAGSIHSFNNFFHCYNDTSLWGIQFVSERMGMDRCTEFILNEWMRICTSASEFEVQRAKNALKTNLMKRLDGRSGQACHEIGTQMLVYGRRIPLVELMYRIDEVSASSLRSTCMEFIYDRCPAVASIGPVEALPDYNRIRGNMWWMRF